MEIYIIRAANPLDMEGSADVVGVFVDKDVAETTVERLATIEEDANRETWGERWRSFAISFEVETRKVASDPQEVIDNLYKEDD